MGEIPAEAAEVLGNPSQLVAWIEGQPQGEQERYAAQIFHYLLERAAQPRSVSMSAGACVKLCGLMDHSLKSSSNEVLAWAFSPQVTAQLFTFYVEWNEYDHHRSMRLVLDLLARLVKKNPDRDVATKASRQMLDSLISIIIGRSTKPVVKSAITFMENFLTKGVFTLDDIKTTYLSLQQDHNNGVGSVWEEFVAEVFRWMRFGYLCPATGKLIVCLYHHLRQAESGGITIDTWHMWLLKRASEDQESLEKIKNYVFVPLFKSHRSEALLFLRKMNQTGSITESGSLDLDIPALLQLAALEVGKKVGLVEEPDLGDSQASQESTSIILHERVLESVLAHPSYEVRTLALSLVVTCPSTTRPYSPSAFDLLQRHLGSFFSDPDAKFRMNVASRAGDMFKRVRGSLSVLKRSIPRARARARKEQGAKDPSFQNTSGPILYQSNLVMWPEAQLVEALEHHERFLKWYIGFLRDELIPTASYQRHVASLKALLYIFRLESDPKKPWETPDDQELFYDLFDEAWLRALFDLIIDPFEDVRAASASAIKFLFQDGRYRKLRLFSPTDAPSPSTELQALLERVEAMARRTSRADHSDGAARTNQLLYTFLPAGEPRLSHLSNYIGELERRITAAETDLGAAVLEAPLHSSFASLCYMWQVISGLTYQDPEKKAVEDLLLRLVVCCERAWNAVKFILCDDSPEGHLPQELEDVEGLDTKDVLSFSFRAIHESSNLMKAIIVSIKNQSQSGHVIPSQDAFRRIGNLTFEQLTNLRHRGAFTTVSSTFASCCQQSKHLVQEEGSESLLDIWYKGTMDTIFLQVSTTRRSAGIPSLMTGILSANAEQPAFESVLERLIEIASMEARVTEKDETNLPQVHAYNCLKDIFKNSLLTSMGNKSEKYLPQCLELAAGGLRSEVWAIRNCGLILLRSLIDCLFGCHESKAMIEAGWDGKTNRIPYHRYPNLPNVLLNLLKTGNQIAAPAEPSSTSAESVFPALDIIRRAGPPDLLRDELQLNIIKYLASPVWHVREIAARTLCSCLLHDKWLHVVKDIFNNALNDAMGTQQNHIHGVLMALKFVFERLAEVSTDLIQGHLNELTRFLSGCDVMTRFEHCPEVIAAYLEVVNLIWAFQLSQSPKLRLAKLEPAVVDSGKSTSALLKIQRTINAIFSATMSEEPVQQLEPLLAQTGMGADTLATALESIPKLWNVTSTSEDILTALCGLYIKLCLQTGFIEAQVIAIQNLAEILDHLLEKGSLSNLSPSSLVDLWMGLPLRPVNPALSNATIRLSGSMLAVLGQLNAITPEGIESWGAMMASAGRDDNSFDTRFAAAESFRSFFTVVKMDCTSKAYLPVLVALYDALNDDDDEVRDMAASAARHIIGQACVPIESARRLQLWLLSHFGSDAFFKATVASRIVGGDYASGLSWESADDQINKALDFDDSLFAIEENNLFIDEVRDAKRWVAVLEAIPWNEQDEACAKLLEWSTNGLRRMIRLAAQEDGPLGWASTPQAFAIFVRILLASTSLLKIHATSELRQAVEEARVALTSGGSRVSGLLLHYITESS
ncbi:putative death-receptor fusion protein-domain-containing protein [Stachybotrys elegans]|uniref:Death-receptor fusion protein-domain-containing protein n=1 Tax=Stachybotrys elegans TaxID=80388 RepID=A0A8K0WYT0_9HYPO|nr:putative death-receptor fusion protein-domain-containing protein [Stachybotrys elegans]